MHFSAKRGTAMVILSAYLLVTVIKQVNVFRK